MKIKSMLEFNTSLLAKHTKIDKEAGTVVIGGALPEYIIIPAGATLELADSEWPKFEKAAEVLLEKKSLVMVEAPALTEEQEAAAKKAKLAAAKKLVAELSKEGK